MFSHVTIGTRDFAAALAFYDAVLAPLGIQRVHTYPEAGWAGWQRSGEKLAFWVGRPQNGLPATWGNGWMAAFDAPSCDAVDAVYAAALQQGGTDEGAPGPRPLYGPDYYGAYFRDPDGNKLCVVHRDA